jgi:hypothetical protein
MKSKQEKSKREVRHKFYVVRQFAYVHRSECGYIPSINKFGLQYNIYIMKHYYPQNTLANLVVICVSPDARSDGFTLVSGH